MVNIISEKECKKCNEIKSVSEFYKASNLKDGYENTCKICRNEARKKHVKNCEFCNNKFKTREKNTRFCSYKCMGENRKIRVEINCSNCNKMVEVIPSKKGKFENYYCDISCKAEHQKSTMLGENNHNFSSKTVNCDGCNKEIHRQPNQLKKLNHYFCDYDCYKENIGQYYSGENNSNWNFNLTIEDRLKGRNYPEYHEWRKLVFERDNYTCQCCGDNTSGNLVAHHILNYSEHPQLRTETSNGTTLCKSCHKQFHDTYGYTNNNKTQLEKFINNTRNGVVFS